jgi:hypothetical protein
MSAWKNTHSFDETHIYVRMMTMVLCGEGRGMKGVKGCAVEFKKKIGMGAGSENLIQLTL